MTDPIKNELGQIIPLHYHFQMLSDKSRMHAFKEAIADCVNPLDQVVDLGCGTGIMSFLAAKQGAYVSSVEMNPDMALYAEGLIKENGVSDRVKIHIADAMEWKPSKKVDVVICEMLHSALLREKQVEVITRFREQYSEHYSNMPLFIPSATLLAVEAVWQSFDFEGYYAPVPLFQDPYKAVDNLKSYSDPMVYKVIHYEEATLAPVVGDLSFVVKNNGTINALRFITKNVLSMNTDTGKTTDWHNQYLVLPLKEEVHVMVGEKVTIKFAYELGDSIESLMESMIVAVKED